MAFVQNSTSGYPKFGQFGSGTPTFITAGTTQTQAGATAIASPVVLVTTGNANDGVILPSGSNPTNYGMCVIVKNLSAAALKVYPQSGGNINNASAAGTTDAAFAHTASLTFMYVLTGVDVWKAVLLS